METPTSTTAEPFRGSLAVELGLITWDRLDGPDVRRLHPDVYVGVAAAVDTRLRIEALSTWSRDTGVVSGPLAALAYGVDCPWDDAQIVLPRHGRRPGVGITLRTDRLPDDEVATRFGCRITSPVRTAFDLARREPLVEAVAAVDALAHVTHVGAAELAPLTGRHAGVRGLVQVRTGIERMDPRAESLPETRLRLGLVDRGVPLGVPRYPLTLRNGRRVRLDLAWPEHRFGLEFNGPEHRTITGQNRDAFRAGRVADLGWTTLPRRARRTRPARARMIEPPRGQVDVIGLRTVQKPDDVHLITGAGRGATGGAGRYRRQRQTGATGRRRARTGAPGAGRGAHR